jgi:hypothetical protein
MNARAFSGRSSKVIALAALFLSSSGPQSCEEASPRPLLPGGEWTWAQLQEREPPRSAPEPGALLLLGIGLVAVAAASRRLR